VSVRVCNVGVLWLIAFDLRVAPEDSYALFWGSGSAHGERETPPKKKLKFQSTVFARVVYMLRIFYVDIVY